MPPRTLSAVPQSDTTDWSGAIVSRELVRHLTVGCVARVVVRNVASGGAEAIYFDITKVKDGTFWGVARGTYRWCDSVGLADGAVMTFGRRDINEIPIEWQPRSYQKAVAHLLARTKDEGYFPTRVRD
ncbi:hypothetical protein HIM_00816 [Hirsutella minnesotensis 3608]|nr:hypothetical protein HIM_00816 [Hirsutella minnesotensis 3608]